jgi:hypothetical protein
MLGSDLAHQSCGTLAKVDVEKDLELVKVDIIFSQDQHNPIYLAKQVSLDRHCLFLGFDIKGELTSTSNP